MGRIALASVLLFASVISSAALSCGDGRAPNSPDPSPAYDARAISRCEHGRGDEQQDYTVEQWRACFMIARTFLDQPPTSLRYAFKSCELGFDEGCLEYMDFVHAMATRRDDAATPAEISRARALGKRFCESGLRDFVGHTYKTAEACHSAGLLYQDVDPVDLATAKAMFEKGCELHDEGSCLLMQHRYAEGR